MHELIKHRSGTSFKPVLAWDRPGKTRVKGGRLRILAPEAGEP